MGPNVSLEDKMKNATDGKKQFDTNNSLIKNATLDAMIKSCSF
jgi:hypothetical protein